MKKPYILEVCVDSVESALSATAGGATRLELCASLLTGGLSPSLALFHEVRRLCDIPIHVLLRPRCGDFLYSDAEMRVLCEEVKLFKQAGANGIVIGCLTPNGALDLPRMQQLISIAGDLSVTLHRAFDMCADPMRTLEQAKALGVHSILTSGQQNDCMDGKPLIQRLLQAAGLQLDILVGSGVDASVICAFLQDTTATSFHMSGKVLVPSAMQFRNPGVSMSAVLPDEYIIWRTATDRIQAAANVLFTNA